MRLINHLSLFGVFLLSLFLGCSDDTDNGITESDMRRDGSGAVQDQSSRNLPDGYVMFKCSKPGQACNPHDPCAFNPVCGPDLLCRPEYLMDCDDKLDCTEDRCIGLGMCSNLPKAGWCRVMYKTGTDDGGVPVTEPRCVKEGTRKPDDPCYGCAPTKSDAGASNDTKWMPISGGTCDDGNTCTKNDSCVNGTCKGTSFTSLCSDGYGCTEDLCDGKGGCLGSVLKAGFCLINGSCYKKGGKKLDGSCNECDPDKSVSDWTPISNTCHIDSKCYNHGDKHPSGCAECDTAASTTSWTVKGSYCYIDKLCKKLGDLDSIKCAQCDPTTNMYAWTPLAGVCKIDNACYNKGAIHPLKCAECDPAASATSWTVKGSYCLINNKCYNPKTTDSINCSTCEPATSKYKWTAIPGLCKISGTCYSKGTVHPGACAECDPTASATSWTVKSTTSACLINNVCKKSGDKDLSGCATCDPAKDKYAWTGTAGLCKIDGACHAKAAAHPKGCATCDPTTSTSSWTPATGKCLINQACYKTGDKDLTTCGSCDPTKSGTAWTVSSGKSCIVGPNKCVGATTMEPGGCGTCDPTKDTNGWTMGAGCLAAHDWSQKFGSSSSDMPYGLAVDDSGNVYMTGYFNTSITFGTKTHSSSGSYDIYLASFTPSGQYRWSITFGGTSSDYGYDVAVDAAGNVYVTGGFYNTMDCGGATLSSKGGMDAFVCAFDAKGNHIWSGSWGSSSADYGYAIGVDASSNVYLTGYFYNTIHFGGGNIASKGSYDIYLVSFDSKGKHRWSKGFGNTSGDYGYGLAVDGSGNVYITGSFSYGVSFGGVTLFPTGSSDLFLASFSPSGSHRWSKALGGASSDYGYALATDKAGNVYLTGYVYGPVNFGGGSLTTSSGDAFIASFTPSGGHRWSKVLGGTSSDYGYGVAADNTGNVYVTGYFYNTIQFGTKSHTSNGSYDAFIASYDTMGKYRWSRTHGSTSSDYGRQVEVGPNGDVYAAGYFYYTVDFGGGSLTASSTDIFLMKIKQ